MGDPLTVSIYSPNDRPLPVVSAVLGDCQWPLKMLEIPTSHATPQSIAARGNPNLYLDQQMDSSHYGLEYEKVFHAMASSCNVTVNYPNPVYGVVTICHQVRWLRWGHPSLFHTATSLLIWYKVFCVRDIPYRLIWMKFINMFSVYAQSGTQSGFN